MFKLSLESEYGRRAELTNHENKWKVLSVTGLTSPAAELSSTSVAGMDGSRFSVARLGNRNIVINMVIPQDGEQNVTELNRVVVPKQRIRVYYSNKKKDVYCDGRVESLEYDMFSNPVSCQISIICNNSYWMDNQCTQAQMNPVFGLFEFPVSLPVEGIAMSEISENAETETCIVANAGVDACGIEIEIEARGYILNPKIMNLTTGQTTELLLELHKGDSILVSSDKGNKHVQARIDCETRNIINCFNRSREWITLTGGDNQIICSADVGAKNMVMTVRHRNLYGGI